MNRTNNNFYVISLIVICVVVAFFFSWKVTIPKYQTNEINLKKLEQEIVSANAKLESLRVAKKDIEELGPVYDQLFVAIPQDTDEPNVISEIEAMASVNKLAVPSIQINDGSGADGANPNLTATAGTVAISFNVVGGFEDISKLTKALESDLKLMNITSITITSSETGIAASYQIEAYKAQNVQSFSSNTASTSSQAGD